ncbi:MAG: leucine-rich repeat domain-containing protein [Eubacteriales bacterium]|nr:leucine-rich repeat domain-containing protein [Eubacteriales bacterium]
MKVKRKIPYIIIILLVLIYLAAIFIAGFSNPIGLIDTVEVLSGNAKVRLSSGKYPVETADLAVVITPEDVAALDGFTSLRNADFSGSTCYSEIMQWQALHPEVAVRYTVDLPNGKSVTNNTAEVDFTGLSHENVQPTLEKLQYLPNLVSIDLGSSSQSASPVTNEDISLIKASYPNALVSYSVDLLGKTYSIYDDYADLAGLTSSGVQDAINKLSYLPNLSRISIATNATTDGSLTWGDLTTITSALPNAVLDYNFQVCGVSATMADTSLDLSSITHADVDSVLAVIPGMNQLSWLNIGGDYNDLSRDDIDRLYAACPNAVFSYSTSLWGKVINYADEALDFNHISMNDQGAAVKNLLPYMRNCKTLDMDSCDVDNDHMAAIRDEFPNIDVIWRIWFAGYSVRTNVETILASKASKYGVVTNNEGAKLKYCTKVKNLDLGHNQDLSDCSFVAYMPELEVCILGMNNIDSIEAFRNCPNIEYFECNTNKVSDLSPLSEAYNLHHLNIGGDPGISDISPLYNLTQLQRLYVGNDPIPQEQKEELKSRVAASGNPKFELNDDVPADGPTEGMWRYDNVAPGDDNWKHMQEYGWAEMVRHPRYEEVRQIFNYDAGLGAYSTPENDPLYYPHD